MVIQLTYPNHHSSFSKRTFFAVQKILRKDNGHVTVFIDGSGGFYTESFYGSEKYPVTIRILECAIYVLPKGNSQ